MHIYEKMITLTRMYCKDNYHFWHVKYFNERTGSDYPHYSYTDKDYTIFPRYLVLAAISKEVDLLVGRKFKSFNSCIQALLSAADYAENETNEKSKVTKEDEKRKYREFILSFNESALNNTVVKRLGANRKLSDIESAKIRKKLAEKWGYDRYWYPLDGKPHTGALFLMDEYVTPFEEEIVDFIQAISLNRFYTIAEGRHDYKHPISEFTLSLYDGTEKICCNDTFEWVVYASHEGTISFGGEKLVPKIKEILKPYESKFNLWE